jgi:hypothetical protein
MLHFLPALVAAYWCLRQVKGADPNVPCEVAFDKHVFVIAAAEHVVACAPPEGDGVLECALAVPKETVAAVRARYLKLPRAERAVSVGVLEAIVRIYAEEAARVAGEEVRTGVRPKSAWTVGRKGPARLHHFTKALLDHVRDADTVDVLGLRAVAGMGPWCVASILRYVLELPIYVPGDSRVGSAVRRCEKATTTTTTTTTTTNQAATARPTATATALRNECVDAYLLDTFDDGERAPCAKPPRRKRKRKREDGDAPGATTATLLRNTKHTKTLAAAVRGHTPSNRCRACIACLTMGPTLRVVYECLNTSKVAPETAEATWRACCRAATGELK